MPSASRRSYRIGAALFNGDHGHLADEVARLEEADVDFIHLDVFDGRFVGDLGFSPHTIAQLRDRTQLPFEVHLGAEEPLRFVPQLCDAGADLIIFHIESVAMVYETLFLVQEQGVGAGLAFSLGTPIMQLQPVINSVDAVLLLSRVTGEGARGATFDSRVLPRVSAVRDMAALADCNVDIQVAGSVKREHVPSLLDAGMTSLAMGGGLYRVSSMADEVDALRALAEKG